MEFRNRHLLGIEANHIPALVQVINDHDPF